jgi:hypothetical protein
MSVKKPVSVRIEGRVTPIRAAPIPPPDPGELVERAFRTALGLASLAVGFVSAVITNAIRREIHAPAEEPLDDEPWPKPMASVLLGAGLGMAIESARVVGRAGAMAGRGLGPWISFATSPTVVRDRLETMRRRANELDDRWRGEQERDERIGSSFLRTVMPQVVDATLEQLDLTELVLSHVDFDRVVDAVDVERVVAGIDLDTIAARIDVEAIVRRLDLTAIAQEVIAQLDLASIAQDVITEIDLPKIVRESTGTMANETVEGIRAQSMSADRALSRVVDRMLRRRDPETDD